MASPAHPSSDCESKAAIYQFIMYPILVAFDLTLVEIVLDCLWLHSTQPRKPSAAGQMLNLEQRKETHGQLTDVVTGLDPAKGHRYS